MFLQKHFLFSTTSDINCGETIVYKFLISCTHLCLNKMPKPEPISNDELSSPANSDNEDSNLSIKRCVDEMSDPDVESPENYNDKPLKKMKESYSSFKTSNEKHVCFPMKVRS